MSTPSKSPAASSVASSRRPSPPKSSQNLSTRQEGKLESASPPTPLPKTPDQKSAQTTQRQLKSAQLTERQKSAPASPPNVLKEELELLAEEEIKSAMASSRAGQKSALTSGRPDLNQKSSLNTERPDPSQKSALTTERPAEKSEQVSGRSEQKQEEPESKQPSRHTSKPTSPQQNESPKQVSESKTVSRRPSQQIANEQDQKQSPKRDDTKEEGTRMASAQKQENETEKAKTPPQNVNSSLPPIQSPPRNENAAFNPSNIDPLANSLPPTPPPKQQPIKPQITGNYLKDDAPLPRRKSRAPFGERLSLVQYNNPEPVPSDMQSEADEVDPVEELKRIANCALPPIEPEKQLRFIMDCVIVPRKREIDGKSWLERASTVPSTRLDILGLQQRFETELNVSHAKSFGICPIRRRIYDELFDELIRQVTINCAERGLLLLRVRDEIHLSMLSYQTLLESAIGYGIRKAVVFEQQQSQALMDRDLEKAKNIELTKRVEELEKRLRQEAAIREEEVKLLEAQMKDENERLIESNRTLKMHLQAILQMDQQLQVQQATLNEVSVKES